MLNIGGVGPHPDAREFELGIEGGFPVGRVDLMGSLGKGKGGLRGCLPRDQFILGVVFEEQVRAIGLIRLCVHLVGVGFLGVGGKEAVNAAETQHTLA